MTLIILIGNSDNKLTQQRWSAYVEDCDNLIRLNSNRVHFRGSSPSIAPYQNHCWVVEPLDNFLKALSAIGKKYNQDSIAVINGETSFI